MFKYMTLEMVQYLFPFPVSFCNRFIPLTVLKILPDHNLS
jgi:hypothetical protein